MTGRVTIVGGGLTGVLAALEAHRLGARDIVLHEHFGQLGGEALSRTAHGLELRDDCVFFGPPGDPVRTLLEAHGAAFEDVERRCGSVSPGRDGQPVWTEDLDGPALSTRCLDLRPQVGDSLADRLRAYPEEIGEALARYCQWRLGVWLNEVHESAAAPLGIERVLPLAAGAEPPQDRLYAASQVGRRIPPIAGLPRGGFCALFGQLRRALADLGVKVCYASLVSPRQALAEGAAGDTLVWAADPTPLFVPLGLEPPAPFPQSVATYLFKASYDGPVPFQVQNFTAAGAVARIYLYESRGQLLVLAECVHECGEAELCREIVRLMAGFGGASLTLGEQVSEKVRSRWVYPSTDAIRRLRGLRARLARTHGSAFVPGAWEVYDKGEKLAQVRSGLAVALDSPPMSAVA